MMSENNKNNLQHRLIQDLLDGQLRDVERATLDRQLQSNPALMKAYVESMTVSAALYRYTQSRKYDEKNPFAGPCIELFWKLMVDHERSADAVEPPRAVKPKRPAAGLNPSMPGTVQRRLSRVTLATAILGTAAMLFMIVLVRLTPPGYGQPVATVVDVYVRDGAADSDSAALTAGDRLTHRQSVHLDRGQLVRIRFDYGAVAVFEGPANFVINSAEQMTLNHGKLFADIPGQAVGFIVTTPNSRILDLGTRFGVHVEGNGSTQLHMISGAASLLAKQDTKTISSDVIRAGQARYVDAASLHVHEIPLQPRQFVQQFCSGRRFVWNGQPFNLASVVGNENGFELANAGIFINPLTGRYEPRRSFTDQERSIVTAFNPVPEHTMIDSTFIPNAAAGPVQIAAEGMVFEGFPETSRGMWVGLRAGAHYVGNDLRGSPRVSLGTSAKQAIVMHTNLGITFDLDTIRQSLPGLQIRGFRALRGFRADQDGSSNKADFWVLVDGRCVWNDLGVRYTRQLEPLWIPLTEDSRYLTLATTESDDGNGNDWTLFVDPVLELVYDTL